MPRLVRWGCGLLGVLVVLLLGALVALFVLATRYVGPDYNASAHTYTVDDGGGKRHADQISTELATSFDMKTGIAPTGLRSSVTEIARAQVQGISLTEEEVNSKLAQVLAANPSHTTPAIERVFVVLRQGNPQAFAYTTLLGQRVVLTSHLTYVFANNTVTAQLTDPHAGKLPVGLAFPFALDWSGQREALMRVLTRSLPTQVTGIEVRDGQLHVTVNLLPQRGGEPRAPDAVRLFSRAGRPAAALPAGLAIRRFAGPWELDDRVLAWRSLLSDSVIGRTGRFGSGLAARRFLGRSRFVPERSGRARFGPFGCAGFSLFTWRTAVRRGAEDG